MLEFALQYAARGWRVFPVHTTATGACSCGRDCGKDAGKHPRIRNWQKAASARAADIERWWGRWPDANIGLATGSGLVVVDIDGPQNLATLAALKASHGPLPPTLASSTGRGLHLYFRGELPGSKTVAGLLVRGAGGYVVAPPSLHQTGKRYQWVTSLPLADTPGWFIEWLQTSGGTKKTTLDPQTLFGPLPAYLQGNKPQSRQTLPAGSSSLTERAIRGLAPTWSPQEEARIMSALRAVPASCDRDTWLRIGMALADLHWFTGAEGGDRGFEIWDSWSATCPEKYSIHDVETRWRSFGKPGRGGVTLGTLYHIAEAHGWGGNAPAEAPDDPAEEEPEEAPSLFNGHANGHAVMPSLLPANFSVADEFASPLIELNEKYAVIGDIGGKCLVMGWVPSKVDDTVKVPSFQAFKSFAERYGSRYVVVKKPTSDGFQEVQAQLGPTWLKWKKRRTFEGIDLAPAQDKVLPGNVLNLWDGFGLQPAPGRWDRMKEHIADVLAQGHSESLLYIMRWAAWKVQHPGERAEVALVFRGPKGSGKGTFANALKRMFGQHGLQIFNSKHLVGSFNGHLRNCLMLFADEAFWAGDKQGESVLKGMLTEPTLMIEQKGIDATPWRNRLGVIMAANAEWVVPASHDERRYAVFNVSESRVRNEKYFDALHQEIHSGGLAAMLWDLQHADLGGWHPRRVPITEALQQQKLRSLDPRLEWYEGLLQDGLLPYSGAKEGGRTIPTHFLIQHVRESTPRLRDLSATALGLFLRGMGCIKMHGAKGNGWQFAPLTEARGRWEQRFGAWKWEHAAEEWGNKI